MEFGEKLKENIKRNLPRGSINKIAKKTGYSRQTVSNVIQGKSRNEIILKELLKACRANIDIKQKLMQLS